MTWSSAQLTGPEQVRADGSDVQGGQGLGPVGGSGGEASGGGSGVGGGGEIREEWPEGGGEWIR